MLIEGVALFQIFVRPPPIVRPPVFRTRAIAAVHRLWNPVTWTPVRLVSWAVAVDGFWRRGSELPMTISHSFGGREITQVDQVANAGRHHFVGAELTADDGGTGEWRVRVAVARPSHGTEVRGTSLTLPREAYAVSEIVIGDMSQGLAIRIGEDTIHLAPRQVVSRSEPLAVYFQVMSPAAHERVRVTYRVLRLVGGEAVPEEVFSLSSTERLVAGVTSMQRVLDTALLTGDQYLLEIVVEGETMPRLARTVPLHLWQGPPTADEEPDAGREEDDGSVQIRGGR